MQHNGKEVILKNRKHKKVNKKRGQATKGSANETKMAKYINNGHVPTSIIANNIIDFKTPLDKLRDRITFWENKQAGTDNQTVLNRCKKELKPLYKQYKAMT